MTKPGFSVVVVLVVVVVATGSGFGRVTGMDDGGNDENGDVDDGEGGDGDCDDCGLCVSNGCLLSTDVVIGGNCVVVLGTEVVLVKIDANDMGGFVSVLEKNDEVVCAAASSETSFSYK